MFSVGEEVAVLAESDWPRSAAAGSTAMAWSEGVSLTAVCYRVIV